MKISALFPRNLDILGPALKVIAVSFLAFTFLFFAKSSFAQTVAQNSQVNSYAQPNTNPDVPNNLHTWTQSVMIEVMSALSCQLAGVDPADPSGKCLGVDPKTGKIGYAQNGGGAIGIAGTLIASTFTIPIHTADYISYVTNNFGIVKTSYAATPDTGYNQLSPLVNVWKTFRDIVYLIFVLLFVIIGLGIMLRIKIDPRTVMTIQNQIPKIIIGLILVTFSFAIAGLLIDVMWIAIYLIINIFNQAQPGTLTLAANPLFVPAPAFGNNIFNSGAGGMPLGGIADVASHAAGNIASLITSLFRPSTTNGNITPDMCGVQYAGNPIFYAICEASNFGNGNFVGGAIDQVVTFIVSALAFIIIAVAILWSLIKLWFALITAYIFILVDVIFAPFWIIGGLLPGSGENIGFMAWIRDMLGNLIAFPVTIAMFMLGKILIIQFSQIKAGSSAFVPPLIGDPGNVSTIGSLVALGIIFTTPHIVDITKKAVKAPKIDLGPIGQAVSVGVAYPINVTKNIGGTIASSEETILKKGQGTQAEYGQRGAGRAFVQRFFGR